MGHGWLKSSNQVRRLVAPASADAGSTATCSCHPAMLEEEVIRLKFYALMLFIGMEDTLGSTFYRALLFFDALDAKSTCSTNATMESPY
jgi:hypothetical protein